ncbi:MAG: nucleotidyl transferase AbiEii/AbiGii toxin family protein [Nitrospiraceae bacterium]|nr:nucleotidyl transferase AbiEii/AbiGii toxin family protein [Nitrospiraceae bacterium]
MPEHEPYPTPASVENAIKHAAQRAASLDPSLGVSKRIELEYFNRFLSRIFSDGTSSDWVLKGGTGMLARVPNTRATRDIDLHLQSASLDEALQELVRLASIDLGDHFRFEYSSSNSIDNDAQPYSPLVRVNFNVFIGLNKKVPLRVDVVTGPGVTGEITTAEPAGALDLPRLVSHSYRLYPVVDQIADKVCATMTKYGQQPSSREKDLVDLVVLATTQDIPGAALRRAIQSESLRRRIGPLDGFATPASWGVGYAELSKSVTHCHGYPTAKAATELLTRLIDPALSGVVDQQTWAHQNLDWVRRDI